MFLHVLYRFIVCRLAVCTFSLCSLDRVPGWNRMNHPGNPVSSWCRRKPGWNRISLVFLMVLLHFAIFYDVFQCFFILGTRSTPVWRFRRRQEQRVEDWHLYKSCLFWVFVIKKRCIQCLYRLCLYNMQRLDKNYLTKIRS